MSGLVGIVNLDEAPVDRRLLEQMAAAISYRGPDAQRLWMGDVVGLGHAMLCTTPEAQSEQQPFSLDGEVWLAADLRIDNREELCDALGRRRPELAQTTDIEILARSYDAWGARCAERIVGDFAFAIWDGRQRRLLCARDPLGVGSLHYARHRNSLFVGTTVGSVLAALPGTPPPNEPLIADFLLHRFDRGIDETFFEGIMRLPPGYLLVAQAERVQLERYYVLGTRGAWSHQDEDEYLAEFREIFAQAVTARLRSCTPVAIQVSGGLDSSSIACMANDLLERGRFAPAHSIMIQSCVYPNLKEMDELEYQRAVVERCPQLEPYYVDAERFWSLKDLGDAQYPFHQPEPHPQRSWLLGNLRAAKESGCRVILDGNAGDFVLGAHLAYARPELLWDLPLRKWGTEVRHFLARRPAHEFLFKSTFKPAGLAFLPRIAERWRLFCRRRRVPWVNWEWASRSLRRRHRDPLPASKLPTRSTRLTYQWAASGWTSMWQACNDTDAGFVNACWRDPYRDRRLVEFLLHVPTRLLFQGGWNKHILRRSMNGVLPEKVRWRRGSVEASTLIAKGLRHEERRRVETLLHGSRLAALGWIDGPSLERAWKDYLAGRAEDPQVLVDAINVESWLRTFGA